MTEDPVNPEPRKRRRGRSSDEPRQAGHSSRRTLGGASIHLSELESGRGSSRGSRGGSERCTKCGLGCGSQHACEVGSGNKRSGTEPGSEKSRSRSTAVDGVPRTESEYGGSWLFTDRFSDLLSYEETLSSLEFQSEDGLSEDYDGRGFPTHFI